MLRVPRPLLAPTLLAGLLLASTGCGFDYATDQVYISSAGVDDRTGDVDVLNAAVVSAQEGSGTFVATFANNSLSEAERVVAISPGPESADVEITGFSGVEVAPGAAVNLADDPTAAVSGEFIPGDFVSVTLDLERGDDITMDVPVVADEGFWDGLDVGGGTSEPSAVPDDTESETTE